MKSKTLGMILTCSLMGSAAVAHEGVKVQSVEQAVKKLLSQENASSDLELDWQKVDGTVFSAHPVVKDLEIAHWSSDSSEEAVRLGLFTVQGDWGPIRAVAATRAATLLGVEIVLFTEHEGDGITREVFLKQFRGLELEGLATVELKPLPNEPRAVEALRAGVLAMANVSDSTAGHLASSAKQDSQEDGEDEHHEGGHEHSHD